MQNKNILIVCLMCLSLWGVNTVRADEGGEDVTLSETGEQNTTGDTASADSVDAVSEDSAEAVARAAFTEATILYKDRKFDASARKFNEAYLLKPSWKLLYNIGQAEASAKRQGLAIAAFEKYLTEGGDEIPVARRDEVLREVERLRLIVGAIELEAPNGYQVVVDGIVRGTTPLVGRLRVAASQEHVIELRDGDTLLESQKIVVGGQETLVVRLGKTEEVNVAKPAVVAPKDDVEKIRKEAKIRAYHRQSKKFKIAGWITLGVGAGIATLGGLGLWAAKRQKDENDKIVCTGNVNSGCAEDLEQKESDQEDMKKGSVGLLVLGIAAMTAAPLLMVVSKKKTARARALESAFLPQLSPDYGGFIYQIQF
ncbi:MAG: hypothetical protein JXR76_09695 [Deltaproteobacteria bacterium]|nr:hypothetical protein [Deltaproteobacteria bacterium]